VTSPPYFKKRSYGSSLQEIGNESEVEHYLQNLVEIFAAVPLAPWGSVWANIGDKRGRRGELLRIPHQFATAMAKAGFLLIDEVVWAKESVRIDGTSIGQAMIEPARNRFGGNGHEPFYRFVRNPKEAWSDMSAVRLPRRNVEDISYLPEVLMKCVTSVEGRNCANVWNIGPGQTSESHYGVYPPALLERPIAMSCPLEVTEKGPKQRIIKDGSLCRSAAG
jgi:DNA modification methylase